MKQEEKSMNTVQRAKGIRRFFRANVLGKPVRKYVVAGDRVCGRMMREARPRPKTPGPSDRAILAWAQFDLCREIMGGFWEKSAA